MRLELENVGKISYANIELNGITVIAGENNSGKSTIGKMLFCVFHAFYKIEEQTIEERIKSIFRALNSYYREAVNSMMHGNINTISLARYIVGQKEVFSRDTQRLVNEIKDFFICRDSNFQRYIDQENLEKLVDRICTILNLEDSEIQKIILRKRLEAEFGMNVGHLNNIEKRTTVKLSMKDHRVDFTVIKNEEIKILNYMNLNKEIIYMDDPFILDDLGRIKWRFNFIGNEFEHRHDLLRKLAGDKKADEFSVVDELVIQKN